MIKAILFLVKVGLLVAAAVWIAQRPGTVSIEWMDYTVYIHVGLFIAVLIITILLAITIFRVIKAIADLPKNLKRYNHYKNRDKGYRALTLGLSAVAAGDSKSASYQSHRALKFLDGDNGLPLLLKAQSERLQGKDAEASQTFLKLLENKDAAFLGVRGLLQAAIDKRDYAKALELAREALALHPKQPWILRVVYELEIRARDWEAARKTLYRAEKAGAIEAEKANSDRVAMLIAEADALLEKDQRDAAFDLLKKAHKFDSAFVPLAVRLSGQYVQRNKRHRALSVVERCWKDNPHPELVPVWELLQPRNKKDASLERLKWYERLLALKPESVEGRMAAARVAMEEGLWGQARNYLGLAEEQGEEDARLYRLWAELEDRSTQNESAAQRWLERAEESPPPRCWVCRETGRIYPVWSPVAEPHGAFNTIRWARPDEFEWERFNLPGGITSETYLEAPKN